MSATTPHGDPALTEPNLALLEGEIVELTLLLPGWQATALEATARGQGLTTGQLVRRLIQEYFARFAQPRSA